ERGGVGKFPRPQAYKPWGLGKTKAFYPPGVERPAPTTARMCRPASPPVRSNRTLAGALRAKKPLLHLGRGHQTRVSFPEPLIPVLGDNGVGRIPQPLRNNNQHVSQRPETTQLLGHTQYGG